MKNVEWADGAVEPCVEDAFFADKFFVTAFWAFAGGCGFFPGLVVCSFFWQDRFFAVFAVPQGNFGGIVASAGDGPVNADGVDPVLEYFAGFWRVDFEFFCDGAHVVFVLQLFQVEFAHVDEFDFVFAALADRRPVDGLFRCDKESLCFELFDDFCAGVADFEPFEESGVLVHRAVLVDGNDRIKVHFAEEANVA